MSFSFLLGFLLVVGIGLWFWRDSLGAREQARAASTRACRQSGVQLLDDTVALMDMLLAKKRAGDRKNWLEEKGNLAEV